MTLCFTSLVGFQLQWLFLFRSFRFVSFWLIEWGLLHFASCIFTSRLYALSSPPPNVFIYHDLVENENSSHFHSQWRISYSPKIKSIILYTSESQMMLRWTLANTTIDRDHGKKLTKTLRPDARESRRSPLTAPPTRFATSAYLWRRLRRWRTRAWH